MSSTFPGGRQDGKSTAGAVPDAEILRAIFCHHQTQKEPRREGAGRGSRERLRKKLKKKRTSAGRGRQRLDKAAGSETQGRAYERRGLVDQSGLKGRSGARGTSCVGDCS